MPGKLARPVRRGAVRKRARELRAPRRTAYPTVSAETACEISHKALRGNVTDGVAKSVETSPMTLSAAEASVQSVPR